jgi:hypothetical protein
MKKGKTYADSNMAGAIVVVSEAIEGETSPYKSRWGTPRVWF